MTGAPESDASGSADLALRLLADNRQGQDVPSEGPPVRWSDLTRAEAAEEWPHLYAWVQHLRARYPNITRLPDCWWQHNDLVEALQALRDYERACFAPAAPATAAIDWQRAFRDTEARIEPWLRRLPCAAGRAHEPTIVAERLPADWALIIGADLRRRR